MSYLFNKPYYGAMPKLAYCDTCVYLDYYSERKRSVEAFKFFTEVISCRYNLVISNWLLTELKKFVEADQTNSPLLQHLRNMKKIVCVSASEADFENAKRINPINWQDSLHALLAQRASADVFITRNLKDFVQYSELFEIKLPEDSRSV